MDITILVIALVALCVVTALNGLFLWFIYRRRVTSSPYISGGSRTESATLGPTVSLWQATLAPLLILVVSVISSAIFYHSLPVEVAYRFTTSGLPAGVMEKANVIGLMLGGQVLLLLLAVGITWAANRAFHSVTPTMVLRRAFIFMGNILAVPQLVLAFLMANIFIYNVYQHEPMPAWIIVATALIAGAIGIILFLIMVTRGMKETRKRS